MSSPPTDQLAAFLASIRQHESGGSYTAYNAAGGASGAYQFIQSTWSSWVTQAGYPQYAAVPASQAPANVQDAAAAAMATSYFQSFGGNWADVAEAWYYPAYAGVAADQNLVPAPYAGNTLTVGQYGADIVATMNKLLGQPNATLTSSNGGGISGAVKGAVGGVVGAIGGPVVGAIGGGAVGDAVNGLVGGWAKDAFSIALTFIFVAAALGLILLGLTRLFPGVSRTITTALPLAAAA